jgi:hypothetical protein
MEFQKQNLMTKKNYKPPRDAYILLNEIRWRETNDTIGKLRMSDVLCFLQVPSLQHSTSNCKSTEQTIEM